MSSGNGATEFTIRRKVFTLMGAKFHIFNAQDQVIGFCQQKAFKLKEDIRIYSDEAKSRELMRINARSIVDFSAAYDVVDSQSESKVGTLRRKGMQSFVRDTWSVLDTADQEIGQIVEDSQAMALVRRFIPLGNLLPQKFSLKQGEGPALAEYRTHFNPFVYRLTVTVSPQSPVSPYLVLASGLAWWLAPAAVALYCFAFYALHNTLQTCGTQMTPQARATGFALFSSAFYVGQTLGVTLGASVFDRAGAVPLFVASALVLPAMALWFASHLKRRG